MGMAEAGSHPERTLVVLDKQAHLRTLRRVDGVRDGDAQRLVVARLLRHLLQRNDLQAGRQREGGLVEVRAGLRVCGGHVGHKVCTAKKLTALLLRCSMHASPAQRGLRRQGL